MNLYEITKEQQEIFALLEENGGELTPELEEALAISNEEWSNKAQSYISMIRGWEAEADMFKSEIERLTARKKTLENCIKRLKEGLCISMTLLGMGKSSIGTHSLRVNHTKAVDVFDETTIPEKYKHVVEEVKIDKKAIKEAIENGEEVDGAVLKENTSIVIR